MRKFILILLLFSCTGNSNTTVSSDSIRELPAKADTIENEKVTSDSTTSGAFLISKLMLNRKVEILIPRDFSIMLPEIVSLKYPVKKGLNFEVYTNKEASINVAFEHTSNNARLDELPAIKKAFEQQFRLPGIDFWKSEIRKINDRDFILIEMVTPATDTEIYNLMFITSSNGKLINGTFNCTMDKQKEWQPIAWEIVNSVRVND